jgi:hypothetical protein
VSIAFAVLGLLVLRRFVSHEALTSHHDVAGYLLSIVGTLYAVVLGLIVVSSLNTFSNARLTVAKEANALQNIFRMAQGLHQPTSTSLCLSCIAYAKVMVEDEWQAMENGMSSPKSHTIVSQLWTTIIEFQPATQRETDLHNSILAEIGQLADNRHMRLTAAEPAYDWIIWTVLIFGGAVVVVFTYFFGVEKLAIQILMTILVTIALSLNLFVVALFGSPYSGDVKVSPAPFASALVHFQEHLGETKQNKLPITAP